MAIASTALHWADILVIVAYFVFVLGVGLFSAYRSKGGSVSGYFLADRSMHWTLVGASLFASNIGSGHFIGLAGSGASSGIGVAGFELSAIFILILLGWLFTPVYLASGVYTMPEYLRKRFGGQRIRVFLSVLALLLYVFTKISADLFSGALFIKVAVGWDLYASICLLLIVAAVFTIAGGLTAVIWTDAVQVVIMLIGAFILMALSFSKTNGFSNLVDNYFLTMPSLTNVTTAHARCALPKPYAMNLFRPLDSDLPWLGMTFGLTISSVWYWCSDQVIVQRTLAAKNFTHAKAGCVLAGWLKFFPLWLIVFPGMAARVLYPDEVACADPESCFASCGSRGGCSNIAYPLLVLRLMPAGLTGLMLSVMMSALMSSLTSIFNSAATLFTIDIWMRIRKQAGDVEKLLVSRVFVILMVGVSILWIPIINAFPGSRLFDYIQAITSYLAPPVCAVYVLAVFVPRVNEEGAFWGLIVGFVVGIIRFIVEVAYPAPVCGEVDMRPLIVSQVHYLHFGIILFVITTVVVLAISYMTKPIADVHLHRLTYWSRFSKADRVSISPEDESCNGDTGGSNASNMTQTANSLPFWRKLLNCLCGFDSTTHPVVSKEEMELAKKQQQITSLDEHPFWKTFCDAMALAVTSVAVFFWLFFR